MTGGILKIFGKQSSDGFYSTFMMIVNYYIIFWKKLFKFEIFTTMRFISAYFIDHYFEIIMIYNNIRNIYEGYFFT